MGKHKKSKELTPQEELKKLMKKVTKIMSSVETLQAKVDKNVADPNPQEREKENAQPNALPTENQAAMDGGEAVDEENHTKDTGEPELTNEDDAEWLEIVSSQMDRYRHARRGGSA